MRAAVIGLLLLSPLIAGAELIPTQAPDLQIAVTPEAPQPGATVLLTARTYATSGTPTYVWTVNGKVVDQGLGRNAITVTAGAAGSETDVTVSASDGVTDLGTATATIRPASVDIVWEGATLVPPLVGLRPLPNGGSPVTFVAIPVLYEGGASIPSSNVQYSWKVNAAQTIASQGVGKSTFTLTPPRFANPFSVSVDVMSPDGTVKAQGSVVVTPQDPGVMVYELAPLLGVRFDRAVESAYALSGDEVTLETFPLYMSRGDQSATGVWKVNGTKVTTSDPRFVTLRKTGNGSGSYGISFEYASAKMFENLTKTFTLTF